MGFTAMRDIIISIIIFIHVITFMQDSYNYIPETNDASRVYSCSAVLYLQFLLHTQYVIIIISGGGGCCYCYCYVLTFVPWGDIAISVCLGLKPILCARFELVATVVM
jgi:hypothetical protein